MKLILGILLLFPFGSALAGANVSQFSGGAFVEVAAADVESKCEYNFAFRDEHKSEAPAYLEPKIIEFAFQGKLIPSLGEAIIKAKDSNGRCIWYVDSEKGKVK